MFEPLHVWVILAMAGATYFTRLVGVLVVSRLSLSPRIKRGLDALPPAILMAVVAPTAFSSGPAEAIAACLTILAALRLPFLAALIVGIVSVALLRLVFGG